MAQTPATYTVTASGGKLTITNNPIITPVALGEHTYPIKGFKDCYKWEAPSSSGDIIVLKIINAQNEIIAQGKYYLATNTGPENLIVNLENANSYTVRYELDRGYFPPDGLPVTSTATVSFFVNAIRNRLPLKKWTVLDVINRVNEVIEPLKKGEKPRFRLEGVTYDDVTGRANGTVEGAEGEQARQFDKILSPEFSFTKMTLREMWQQIGGFIHGEPRITGIKQDPDGKKYFTMRYDMYGGVKMSNIAKRRRVSATIGTNINEYCKALDSSAENLVNQMDWAQGVIIEPFNGGYKTLRCETTTARMAEDNNTFIPTDFPVYAIGAEKKVYCRYIPGKGYGKWDITPYIFEESDYNNLSSFEGSYPYTKAYALYYTQGSKNIKGLFHKAPDAVSDIFQKYAIYNILAAVTGEKLTGLNPSKSDNAYMQLAFEVTYLPVYSTRVQTSKSLVVKGLPRTLVYNQSANQIESRFYGENLKGIVARLGNVDKTYTYHLAYLSDIPKTGTMFDEHYYITAVHTEFLPTYIKVTLALSKDFNRLSQYIGISSNKRMWEVSERQVSERNLLFKDYIVVGNKEDYEPYGTPITDIGVIGVKDTFMQERDLKQISLVSACGQTYLGQELQPVLLPVISSAFGNIMSFSWRYTDNYSAGQQSIDQTVGGNLKGYWGAYVPYCDYYGKIYYYNYSLYAPTDRQIWTEENALDAPKVDNEYNAGTPLISTGNNPYKIRKDSREVLQVNQQIEFVTNREDLIIGSALASSCPLVRGSDPNLKPKLYVFNEKINKFTNHVEGKMNVDLSGLTGAELTVSEITHADNLQFYVTGTFPADGAAWAIVTGQTEKDDEIEDEFGETGTQTVYTGGDILLASNTPCKAGETLPPIYFTAKHKLY